MEIFAVGLNYKTAPVEVREKLAISEDNYPDILDRINRIPTVFESCILSTCNRVEIYGISDNPEESYSDILKILSSYSGLKVEELKKHVFLYTDKDAIRHIFNVSSSLDSMVIGEPQIVCQFKDSFTKARELKTVKHVMTRLFDKAMNVSKKIRTSTGISKRAVSISYAAIELAKKIFGDLTDKNVLLLGAGEMAELAARHLASSGVKHIFVSNRTFEKAVQLADEFGGSAIRFNKFFEFLPEADIIIVSTGAKEPILRKEHFKNIDKERHGKPVFIIDISVPRNVSDDVNELENVFLYNIDDLKMVVDRNLEERKIAAESAKILIDEEVAKFDRWLKQLQVNPVIAKVRNYADEIREAQLERLFRDMPYLNEKERENIDLAVRAIINKILHRPTMYIKDRATKENSEVYINIFDEMFSSKWDLRRKLKSEKKGKKSEK
ncbi:glutamyl-tRNA reductase [Persephonella hydrogeniphila]|uniref:Glutamyl-tRNA reductase n=1 Tax=Persephonella hydrogeniphila TaxID=198703 RepID=A0A285MYF7_9AQUI|nr:glutamyl-tRNA reductase [Persephonella hydrogeniphila]SNZ02128.1 glutamyl-tRNA reductase [Persephonella hydrogeniphila]